MVTVEDIRTAQDAISPYIHKTPIVYSTTFSRMTGASVHIKAENLQKTGAFKVRGAFNKILSLKGRKKVVTVSMGNHAQAVAFAASTLGIESKVIMPLSVSIVKEEATRGYGSEVELHGETLQEALDYALSLKGYTFIHPFDDEVVISGQGTIGLEILRSLPDTEVILVPVGGGGLAAGVAIAVKASGSRAQVIGVQSESASSAAISFRNGSITWSKTSSTLADGISVAVVGKQPFNVMMQYVDDVVTVPEHRIASAILLYIERQKFVVEGAGAVPLAALLDNPQRFEGKKAVLIASGGNIDLTLLDRMIHKGLLSTGRIAVFEVIVDDVPGSLQSLCAVVAGHRGNILTVRHDRLRQDLPLGRTGVTFTVETRTCGHLEAILNEIQKKGFEVRCSDR
jgi:threonine dehydratase